MRAAPADDGFGDMFCGAGGSSTGLVEAGWRLVVAANHWQRAIETHSANHPDAEHLCEDMDRYDMRRLPRTRFLWASVICTEGSPAGGKRKKRGGDGGQLSLIEEQGHVEAAGWERTRATALDVIRATEVHNYDAVIVENVVEFAVDWPLFDWWVHGMTILGYDYRVVCVNSAHVGGENNPFAPQWRDQIYVLFLRKGIRMPDLELRPLAWCFTCEEVVSAQQAWKTHTPLGRRRIGKYREQYSYICPNTSRRHDSFVVEPFVLPAAAAIQWDDLGTRIGDRKRTRAKPEGLAPSTIARIRAGHTLMAEPTAFLVLLRSGRVRLIDPATDALAAIMANGSNHGLVLPVGGNNHNARATPTGEPMRTRMARDTDALVTEPFITMLRGKDGMARGVDEPLATVMTGRHHGLTVPQPFILKNYGGYCEPGQNIGQVTAPVSAVTAKDHHALVVPYRGRRSQPSTTATPLHTMATRDSAALVQPDIDVADDLFRMLKPREHLNAQRFPGGYIVTGNQGEQTMQAGNAVSVNVAHWLGLQLAEVL
jgi:DNA (cytosine-5)-methyltransferase 1